MSTTKTQRIMSFVLAILFFASSVGIVAYYVLVNQQQEDQQQALQEAINESNQQNDQQQTNKKEGKLEGTKLSNFTPVASVTALQTTDVKEGSGTVVKSGDTVTVHYTGALAKDGTIFQSSLDMGQPVSFGLDQVIKGWTQGIPGMKVGGTRRLVIPANLAYGNQAQGNIPANSDLVFDVELIKIGQ
jgi:FKBP-type peptidyl-prolyl cis-trans isomerase